MRLSELMKGRDVSVMHDTHIKGLTADSRHVEPGFLFAALSGTMADGREYIVDAVKKGAVAILTDTSYEPADCDLPCFREENPRLILARLASRFYGAEPETITAVTGTNGKTSVAYFTRAIWQAMGLPAASIGTLGVMMPDQTMPLGYTTPDPVLLHKTLTYLVGHGIQHAVIEASSHGLDQYRLDGARIKSAAFTNLTRDHLDYHSSSEDYLGAKLGLISRVLDKTGTAVLNADSGVYPAFLRAAKDRGVKIISYGRMADELKLISLAPESAGQVITVEIFGTRQDIMLPLAGEFQVMNALCALGLVIGAGGDPGIASQALSKISNVPGRLELVSKLANNAAIYVDYAHSPDALETVLEAVRSHAKGKIHVVFGCGGDRDKGKRAEMGRIAGLYADRAIVTDDNPRTEDPVQIRAEIIIACPDALNIGDRFSAIETAIKALGPEDILVVAGKGHEEGQVIGTETIPFNDKKAVQQIVSKLGGKNV
ncbi:UDP-N-acetylmuramoyl-L-alanyl-D-glutamate--2,6-diaminopimelate ligase [Sneathiella sp.]|uniref:UDP-N-acetylmuramoyl-L-alanyl-D-glutamate--2, 6-diaminopimelate ligase n=1 Tax=Sneathiella sp. TaxID=1964365 RepID=UPI00262ED02F|nr:UDP-N-acetylmuramoyl-L-alanyl-D-glutamate--2,6-diaminopimelate ligase [Sneathiella sp.]MDF2368608.1 UDP-N-acetylmuramoyl-L-alanyl-D-glutamate--2,6-diaminopimelate ligase [Sneathiella sp.]